MRTVFKVVGVVCIVGGIAHLIPALILLNQRLGVFRTHWGIFDVSAGGVPVSDAAAEAIFGAIGTTLLVLGCVLFLWPGRRVA